ncbi:TPA: fibronectin-binding domain-containing protein, partial [Candidatus Bathyarchaeota archaeon]|nr:fibronectin-binding domain-containing protein [Candidatus Bathyarchaeota archaeon]
LDEFYTRSFAKEKTSEVEGTIEQQIARLERILKDQERTIQKSLRQAETYRRIGETIYLHLNELQFLIQKIMSDKRSGKSWKEIMEDLIREKKKSRVPAIYFEAVNPKTMMLRVSINDLAFDLDLKISAQKNAAQYYERAKKAEKRAKGAEEALKRTQTKIEEAKRRRLEKTEQISELPPKMKKREWYEKFRWFHSSEGFLAIGGRDKTQNEMLIKRYMEPKDLVFHAEITGAPFVLLKTRGKQPSENTIYEAAQFAGSYSRAWKEGLGSINVYWINPDQISKSPPSGEYLSKGAFMIYGSRNYVRNVPLEIAIGLKKEEDQIQVIGGPPQAIANQTGIYVKIVPGNESSGQLAKRIRRILAKMLSEDERRNFQKIPLEEIQRFIPSGRGAISNK